jgi:60 kDa SS-A/Ro ribonucleoprotein
MSKLNPTVKGKSSSKMIETKLAGGTGIKAAKQGNSDLLRRLVLANLLWEDNAYTDGESTANQIAKIIPTCDPVEVSNLAFEARVLQKLRHTPLFIAVEMLKHDTHKSLVASLLPKIITRPDMMTDFLSIYQKQNNLSKLKKIANAAKRGLAASFNNFDEYAFAKYDRDGAIKLRDVMFLTHPTPEQGKEELFKKIANRTLSTPDTWEVALSAAKTSTEKRAVWERLLSEKKLGALAFLRNLRNMVDVSVDAKVIKTYFKTVKSGMLLPLNFINALQHAPQFASDISAMMVRNYSELPKLPGYTIFVVDVSGSMQSAISSKSAMSRLDAACAMAILANECCESVDIYVTAGNDGTRVHSTTKIQYPKNGFELGAQILDARKVVGGGGIFTRQCLEFIKTKTTATPDRIIIFSDSADCDNVNTVPKPFGKNNYIVDVSSEKHGVNYKGVWTAEISGWSEHFINYIAAYEGLINNVEDFD